MTSMDHTVFIFDPCTSICPVTEVSPTFLINLSMCDVCATVTSVSAVTSAQLENAALGFTGSLSRLERAANNSNRSKVQTNLR